MEDEEGLEEDVADAKHVEAENKESGANDVRKDQDRELEGEREFVVAAPEGPPGPGDIRLMRPGSDIGRSPSFRAVRLLILRQDGAVGAL